jgi:hypothetical protein
MPRLNNPSLTSAIAGAGGQGDCSTPCELHRGIAHGAVSLIGGPKTADRTTTAQSRSPPTLCATRRSLASVGEERHPTLGRANGSAVARPYWWQFATRCRCGYVFDRAVAVHPHGRSVAQPGSASVWGTGGRGFKSRRSDQRNQGLNSSQKTFRFRPDTNRLPLGRFQKLRQMHAAHIMPLAGPRKRRREVPAKPKPAMPTVIVKACKPGRRVRPELPEDPEDTASVKAFFAAWVVGAHLGDGAKVFISRLPQPPRYHTDAACDLPRHHTTLSSAPRLPSGALFVLSCFVLCAL